ncbi:MAG TPA: hypothetical protein VFW23_16790 [Tepidisphaeraceae bacterium]|nr:hypothetical protein [Tepidisphaeraceae bacterium]
MLWFSRFRRAQFLRAAKTNCVKAGPCIEPLESRRLFSHMAFHVVQSGENEFAWLSRAKRNAPVTANSGAILSTATSTAVNVLTIYGTSGNDSVTITNSQVTLNSQVLSFGSAAEIVYIDNGGNDSITIDASQTPVFIYVGSASSDSINTQNGSVYLLFS